MFDCIDQVLITLEEALQRLDPERLQPEYSKELLEKFIKVERLGAAGKALTSRRVAGTNAWQDSGFRSPAHYMADAAKCTVGHAVYVLQTAEAMKELPAVEQAYRRGQMAENQAIDVALAAEAHPPSQDDLLDIARHRALVELRRECARVRAAALPEEERHERIHRNRQLRHWTDLEGAFRLDGRLTPEAGAVVLAALEPFQREVARRTAQHRSNENASAQAADALVEMAESVRHGGGQRVPSGPAAMVHVRIDLESLRRGHTDAGEVCEIPGVGPIPVSAARAMMADGFLAAIVTDGQDVRSVSHMGRTVHARVRTALFERDQGCVAPGCNDAGPLAIDHISEYHLGGPTALHNLCLLCKWHHYLKTHHGYTIRRLHGKWLWEGPKGGPPTEQPWQSGLPTMPRMWNQDRLGPPPPKHRRRRHRIPQYS